MWIVINDNFTASAINPRRASGKRRSVASIASEEIESIDHDRNFGPKSKAQMWPSSYKLVIADAFFLSLFLSFYINLRSTFNRRLTASNMQHKGNSVAEIRSNVGIFSRSVFLEAIYFRLQNTRIYVRFRLARYEVGDAKGTKFRVTINIAWMEVRSTLMFHQI